MWWHCSVWGNWGTKGRQTLLLCPSLMGSLLQWECQSDGNIKPLNYPLWLCGCISWWWICWPEPESHLLLGRRQISLRKPPCLHFLTYKLRMKPFLPWSSFQIKRTPLRVARKMLLRLVFPLAEPDRVFGKDTEREAKYRLSLLPALIPFFLLFYLGIINSFA